MQQMRVRYSDFFTVQHEGPMAVVQFEVLTILDTAAVNDVAIDLYALVDHHDLTHLVIDMTGIRFLSSQALGTLVNLQRKLNAVGGKLVLAGIGESIARMFRITRLDSLFTFCTTADQAARLLAPALPHQLLHV